MPRCGAVVVSERPLTGRAVFRSVLRNRHPGLVLRGRIVLFFVADTSGRPVAAVSREGFGAARRGLFSGVESSYFLWLTFRGDPLRWFSVKGSVRLAGCCSPGAILRSRIVLFFVADILERPLRLFAGAGGFSGSELRIVQVPLFVARGFLGEIRFHCCREVYTRLVRKAYQYP